MALSSLIENSRKALKFPGLFKSGVKICTRLADIPRLCDFDVENQVRDNWCWAAVAVSVSRGYGQGATPWTKCLLANDQLKDHLTGTDCCDGNPDICDQQWCLENALFGVAHYAGITGKLDFEIIEKEISEGRPVACRVKINRITSHFVLITGAARSTRSKWLHIEDPKFLWTCQTYDEFLTEYIHNSTWKSSYYTK